MLTQIINDDFDNKEASFLLGYALLRADSLGLAYVVTKHASDIAPESPSALHNLGKIFHEIQKDKEADEYFRRAVKVKPNYPPSLEGLSMSALHRGEWEECISYANRSLAEDPEAMDARVNRGMAYLAQRRWIEGWRDYNANVGREKNRKEMVYGTTPRWDKSKGKNVVVYGEQGIGDEISFASCLPELIKDSKSVTIECDKRLTSLFKRSFPTCEVFGTRYKEERDLAGRTFDGKVAIGALPEVYRRKDSDFHGKPYLTPNPDQARVWRAVLDSLGPKPKIGITWTGGIPRTGQRRRSVTLDTFAPLFNGIDADWISLQYKDTDGIKDAEDKYGIKIHDWELGNRNKDYDQTVALISELDLVISVCTTVVHACGAIGKECWNLVPTTPLWRYLAEGSSFPWGSSVTMYRQKNGKEWPIYILLGQLKDKYPDRLRNGRSESASAVKKAA